MPLPSLGGLATGLGGLANVLGLGFEGYAKDEAARASRQKDLSEVNLRAAEMAHYKAQDDAAKAKTDQEQLERDTLGQYGPAASTGDKAAQGRIVAVFGPRAPTVMEEYRKLNSKRTQYDPDRGVMVDLDTGAMTPIAGLQPKPHALVLGEPGYNEAFANQEKIRAQYAYHPPPPQKGMWAHDNTTGTDVWVTPDQAASAPDRFTKPVGGGGRGGAGAISPESTQAMFDSADSAAKYMDWYEKKHPNGPGWIAGGVGSSSIQPRKGLGSALEAGAANIALGVFDPEYQTYLAAQRRFGNVFSNLQSRRYTEHQSVLDTDLSGMNPGEAANTIALKKQFRQDLLNSRPAPPTDYKRQTATEFQTPDDTILGGSPAMTTAPSFQNSLTPAAPATAPPTPTTAAPKTKAVPGATMDYSTMNKGQLWDQAVRENGIQWVIKNLGPRTRFTQQP